MLSTETIIVVVSNTFSAIVSAALLILVMWQSRQKRTNQALAVMMLCVSTYCALNAFSRFLSGFDLSPEDFWYGLFSVYGLLAGSMFLFTLVFAGERSNWSRLILIVSLISTPFSLVALWSGLAIVNIRPLENGAYTYTYGPAFLLTTANVLLPYLGAFVTIRRAKGQWVRAVLPALICLMVGLFSGILRPIVGMVPLNAILLAAATLIIGRAVLKSQLFNPLAELNAQLAQKNRELFETGRLKSLFLSNMSHELRTPLNSIIGYTGLILDGVYGPLTDKQRDRLEKVTRNGQHLLSVINDVLDLSGIESGQLTLNLAEVSIHKILDAVFTLVEPLAARKQLALSREEAQNLPLLFVDEKRTRQILVNVISNAIKFTPSGSVVVRAQLGEDKMIRIEVQDTGIGISEDQQGLIFEEFRQVDGTSTREFQGTGLGLAITRRLVELHGGRIWLTSQLNQGTTFFITLPLAQSVREMAA